jgi:hypothetical protein
LFTELWIEWINFFIPGIPPTNYNNNLLIDLFSRGKCGRKAGGTFELSDYLEPERVWIGREGFACLSGIAA